ncbi:MAG TPA: SMP-30/gluconolactonase/LRE family protein [Acidimicrobiia bacterium]|nr:SMP-30/gluconolactonase/LRE family protein [Acidimicrobiia bacterium]
MLAVPMAIYGFACSEDSDPTDDDLTRTRDGGDQDDGGTGNHDSGILNPDDSGQRSECEGNPLIESAADGGALLAFDGGAIKEIAKGEFLDGPQWIDDGDNGGIVYSEVNNQQIIRNGPDGGSRVILRTLPADSLPIGNAQADGFIYTTLAKTSGGGGILRMQLDGGAPTGFDGGPAIGANDIVASSKGFLYFTDPNFQVGGGTTGVYLMAPDGAVTTVTSFPDGDHADGIALTEDGSTLYVGFFGQKRITKYSVDASGVASSPQDLTFTPIDNPTGIAVDVGGNLWIAENDSNGEVKGRIEIVHPTTGKKWAEIPFPDARPTGVAFGGADNKTVYVTTERITDEGSLYVLTSRCAGVR